MSKYMEILGAAVPPVQTASGTMNMLTRAKDSPLLDPTKAPITTKDLAFSVLGGIAGAVLWKKHPVLGAIGGVAVGSSVEPMMRGVGSDRMDVAYRLGIVGAGVAASLHFKKHPAMAYVGGALGATLVSSYMNNSPMNRLSKRLEA